MMRFHLNHSPVKSPFDISHHHRIFLAGSCFSENIGKLLEENRFPTFAHPCGIMFNPLSIHFALSSLVNIQPFNEKYIVERDGVFFSFMHHSSVHDIYQSDLLKKINNDNNKAAKFLKDSDCLIITFGSAFVYKHLELDAVVANCHKQPAALFEKVLVPIEQIVSQYAGLIKQLTEFNPALKIIFTVSPVKYLKDGLTENSLSKATLLLSVHRLVEMFANCFYFPAYELVTDDLRDYRFYKEDLAHPNDLAIGYVWQKFSECFFTGQTAALNRQIDKLNQALDHRRLIANSAEALKLNEYILRQRALIKNIDPGIDLG